ncbi:MAG: hypothetical protein SFU83_08340, partial [Meiothermus sp.]|nr:hypothetical protein [Meiothermus sp.]
KIVGTLETGLAVYPVKFIKHPDPKPGVLWEYEYTGEEYEVDVDSFIPVEQGGHAVFVCEAGCWWKAADLLTEPPEQPSYTSALTFLDRDEALVSLVLAVLKDNQVKPDEDTPLEKLRAFVAQVYPGHYWAAGL